MTRINEPRDSTPEEEVLRDLFGRTATPLSDQTARRIEAVARGIPWDTAAHRGPLLGWLAAATALATAAVVTAMFWPPGDPTNGDSGAPAIALSQDIHVDAAADTPAQIATPFEEQSEAWESDLDPFADEEAPSLVGSVSLAHGLGDPTEVDLWVQAADEILAEVDGI